MPINSASNSFKFQMPCAERLPCGRCKLIMGMCPDNQPYTVTWTTTDVNTPSSLWESNHTVDPNSDAFKN